MNPFLYLSGLEESPPRQEDSYHKYEDYREGYQLLPHQREEESSEQYMRTYQWTPGTNEEVESGRRPAALLSRNEAYVVCYNPGNNLLAQISFLDNLTRAILLAWIPEKPNYDCVG